MNKNIKSLNIKEQFQQRPGMFLGSSGVKGIVALFIGLIEDVISVNESNQLFIKLEFDKHKQIHLEIRSHYLSSKLIEELESDKINQSLFILSILKKISDVFIITVDEPKKFKCVFSIDFSIFREDLNDFQLLNEAILQCAILNRNTKILLIDRRNKYLEQNYHHYPEGVLYLYKRICNEVLGSPNFQIEFDSELDDYKLQIVLAYRTDWFPNSTIISYANDENTPCGGDLVDGIFEGFINGCRKHVAKQKLDKYKIRKKKFKNGLILVCSIRGKEFEYGGSFKTSLIDNDVKILAKKLLVKLTVKYLAENPEIAEKFLFRFDDSNLMSKVF